MEGLKLRKRKPNDDERDIEERSAKRAKDGDGASSQSSQQDAPASRTRPKPNVRTRSMLARESLGGTRRCAQFLFPPSLALALRGSFPFLPARPAWVCLLLLILGVRRPAGLPVSCSALLALVLWFTTHSSSPSGPLPLSRSLFCVHRSRAQGQGRRLAQEGDQEAQNHVDVRRGRDGQGR